MGNQRIDECAGGMSGSWVHGETLRLVDNDKVWILMQDDKGDVLPSDLGSLACRQAQFIGLANLDLAAKV